MYQISADLVKRELRNATFEGKNTKPSLTDPTLGDMRSRSGARVIVASQDGSVSVVVFEPFAHPVTVPVRVRRLALAVMSVCGERATFRGKECEIRNSCLHFCRPLWPKGRKTAGPKSQIESRDSVDWGLLRIWTCGAGRRAR